VKQQLGVIGKLRTVLVWLCQIVLATISVNADASPGASPFQERDRTVLAMGSQIKHIIETDFSSYDHDYLQKRELYGRTLSTLAEQLAAIQAKGNEMACSNQIFLEAKWLHRYTADWMRLGRHLARLAESLKNPNQAFALRQSTTDGLWGLCYEEWFLRVGLTMEALGDLHDRGETPEYPMVGLDRLNTPAKLRNYIESLLISDIARTGRDNRGELTAMMGAITAAAFKKHLTDFISREVARIPKKGPRDPLASYRVAQQQMLSSSQDPQSGYWGAWYRSNGRLYRTVDLSMTFHTVAYRGGEVDYWPQIIETTFNIMDEPYPYGWRHHGDLNNHNNYDVARIFRFGWPHMTGTQKARASTAIRWMLEWTLTESLETDGRFRVDPTFFDSLAATYRFGVLFLDRIGYWNKSERFWTHEEFPHATQLCALIARRMAELQLDQWEAREAIRSLDNCRQPQRNE
jgi:hypothetical protein